MIPVLLFVFYCCLCSFFLYKIKFVRKTNIPWKWLVSLFLLKVIAGCIYGYLHSLSPYYPDKIDTWKFYFESLKETDLLTKDPAAFFRHLLGNGYNHGGNGLLSNTNSYWNDLKHNVMIMLMGFFNLFSGKNYYINVLFFNFLTFFGPVAFYRFCLTQFEIPKKILLFITFCIPSFLFWGSGFHKEGLLFMGMAFLLYCSYKILYGKKLFLFSLIFSLAVLGILFGRSYLLLFLIPYFLIWIMLQYHPVKKPFFIYTGASLIFMATFFCLPAIIPQLDLPLYTSNAQHEFLSLGGRTAIPTDSLMPTAASFLKHAPGSVATAFYAPGWHLKSLVFLPSLAENTAIILLFFLLLIYGNKKKLSGNTGLFFLFFSVSCLIFLGYSVPVTGAIIRYKSILLPFLIVFLINGLDANNMAKRLRLPDKF